MCNYYAALILLFTVCPVAMAEPVWDDTILVSAIKAGPEQWLACPRGSAFKSQSAGQVSDKKCYDIGVFHDRLVGEPRKVTLQELLDIHFVAPKGYSAKAVGPMPALFLGARGNYYDSNTTLIAYKLQAM